MSQQTFSLKFLSPSYWGIWLFYLCFRLIMLLPFRIQLACGACLGYCLQYLLLNRRKIVATNLRLCFPHLNEKQLKNLLRLSFISQGRGVIEMFNVWWGRIRWDKRFELHGESVLQEAIDRGKGVMIIAGHFHHDQVAACFITKYIVPLHIRYQKAHDPLVEWLVSQGRQNFGAELLPTNNIRQMLRILEQGKVMSNQFDVDGGTKQSTFVPFFGVAAATLNVTHRIAQRTGASVVYMRNRRLTKGRYRMEFLPVDNYPSGDMYTDGCRVHELLEAEITDYPEQYFWLHRRFKTRPPGEPSVYPPRRRRRERRKTR